MIYENMTKSELEDVYNSLLSEYNIYKNKNLKLDMSRGKPSPEQLDLAMKLLNMVIPKCYINIDNIDIRNYGCLDGLPEIKKLFGSLLSVKEQEVIIGGNSSLNLMHDIISNLMLLPSSHNSKPWCKYSKIKFLCPVPGYDRHFKICEKFGIDMVNIKMNADGPDMEQIEQFIKDDETVKGIWCVPQYSNPTGVTYSNDVVKKFAALKPKAKDFKIFWDNAYFIHHLYEQKDNLLNILDECKKNNNEDMVYIFASTSKISFPGAGVSAVASSEKNIIQIKNWMSAQTIGHDKINQLRHLLFFKNKETIDFYMKKHAEIIRPKFELVTKILDEKISGMGLATWNKPNGGYFISLNTLEGCATKVIDLCKKAGVIFTDAGATFPYGINPKDDNIRIAPSYPNLNELAQSIELLCLAIKIVSIQSKGWGI